MIKSKSIIYVGIVILFFTSAVMCESENSSVEEARTFGHHFLKRISFAIIPAAFVFGLITTLLAALTVVSVKSLGVGLILLILTIGQMIARSLPQPITAFSAAPAPVIYKDW